MGNIKNTFNDVRYLAKVGLIELKKSKEVGKNITLRMNYDKILLKIPV